jgi:short-subunit dehydrogenase
MLHVLAGRTALVTGASRGLGVFIARRLAKERMHLVLSARDGRKLAALREELAREGLDVRIVAADVRSASERARLVEEAGAIDVLVNNAGLEVTRAFADQSEADVAAQLETNLVAPIDLSRRVLPASSRVARAPSCTSRRCPARARPRTTRSMLRRSTG